MKGKLPLTEEEKKALKELKDKAIKERKIIRK